jgi:hypothetical protein
LKQQLRNLLDIVVIATLCRPATPGVFFNIFPFFMKRPYYWKIFERDSAWSPKVAFTFWRASVALSPALKHNFIANRCSILKSMTRLSHTASFHATNHKYRSTHLDNTMHTTCQDLLLRFSVGDSQTARLLFTLHNVLKHSIRTV